MITAVSRSEKETKKVASFLAWEIRFGSRKRAVVVALEGNLGSGKTTFVQGFARALGVRENVLSPTFVLMKVYPLTKTKKFKHLIHIDCYRLDSPKDLVHLGFKDLIKDQDAIILIEWADRVKKLVPINAFRIRFRYGKKPRERILYIK